MQSIRPKALLLAVLVVVCASVLILAGCGRQAEEPIQTPIPDKVTAPVLSGEPVKVGAIFSVTGPGAPLGEPEQASAKMLVEQINAEGGINGRPLEIIIEDDATEESKAASAAKKLLEQDKVCAIIGPTMSGTSLAIIDTMEKAGIPLFSCAASAKITNPVKKWVFSSAQTDVLAVKRIVKYLEANSIKNVAIIYDSNAFGTSGAEQLKAQLPAAGVKIVDEEKFGTKDTDMTAQLTKIKAKKPEAVICWGTNPGPAVVAKNMKSLGIEAQLIQSHGVANSKFIELAGDAAEGVVLPAGKLLVAGELPESDPQKAVLMKFSADYEAATGKPADTFGGHAYDSLAMLVVALKSAGEEPAALRDAIEAIQGHAGIGGVFNLSATDHNGLTEEAFTFVKITGGKWTMAE